MIDKLNELAEKYLTGNFNKGPLIIGPAAEPQIPVDGHPIPISSYIRDYSRDKPVRDLPEGSSKGLLRFLMGEFSANRIINNNDEVQFLYLMYSFIDVALKSFVDKYGAISQTDLKILFKRTDGKIFRHLPNSAAIEFIVELCE